MHRTWWGDVVSEVLNGVPAVVICLLYRELKPPWQPSPDWCTMSWMPAKMSPLQTSHISDGPFNSHRVAGRPNSQKERKKRGDNLISYEHEMRVKRLEI